MFIFILLWSFSEDVVWQVRNDSLSEFVAAFDQVVVTETEELFVLDTRERRIYHLDTDGEEKHVFGRQGEGPGEMQGAMAIQYVPNRPGIYIYDFSKNHLLAFSPRGEVLPDKMPNSFSLSVLNTHQVVFVEMPRFDAEPNQGAKVILEDLRNGEKRVLLKNAASQHQGPARASYKGSRGSMYFPWYTKTLLAVSPDRSWFAMGSSAALDFQVFDVARSQVVGRISSREVERPVLRDEEIATMTMKVTLGGKVFTARDFPQPDYKPPVEAIFCDVAGRVWVELARGWQAKERVFRVYGKDGKQLGGFKLPVSTRFIHATEDHLFVSVYDEEEDYWTLQKRRYALTGSER